ncbi:preprotein translocase subunit YajC [Aureimonas jatrophae]|uniref:Sec translocon accessory complex subunit YajC n=1 Tax=Aureimonas jatrophae TaxID=1166073 RepID=A0A1H0MU83_9HYPH|nr:preprotein translocase subunit YajC [Aureimonas jatrophae]MBB3951214.1 preprotein translocase subunit YajC [Aureimonas jatrophae]SDO84019.1 protein translocase subunit yajC [Aureimonas jatrophae]
MFVTPAFAQTGTAAGGPESILISVLPFIAVFAIMYFLIIRPQRAAAKRRDEMLKNIRRGDTIITGGGIVAKVTKVMDNGELEVQISEQTKIRVLQGMVADVRVKGEPTAANTK